MFKFFPCSLIGYHIRDDHALRKLLGCAFSFTHRQQCLARSDLNLLIIKKSVGNEQGEHGRELSFKNGGRLMHCAIMMS